jgi:protein TonB
VITGFNTDVEHRGRVFHVQTEEKGPANQVVETLVYSGGEIVAHISTSYAKFADSWGYDGEQLLLRMRHQHKTLIHALLANRLDLSCELERPIEPSLDELVSDCLVKQPTSPEDAAARKRKLQGVLARLETEIEQQQNTRPSTMTPSPESSSPRSRPRRVDPTARQVKPRRRSWRGPIWGLASLFVLVAVGLLLVPSFRPSSSGPALTESQNSTPPVLPSPPAPELAQDAENAKPTTPVDTSGPLAGSVESAQSALPQPEITAEPNSETLPGGATSALVETVPPSPKTPQQDASETAELPIQPVGTAGSVAPSSGETVDIQAASVTPAPRPDENPPEPPELPPNSDATPPSTSADTRSWAGRLIDLDAVDQLPRALQRPFPDYTKRARKLKQEGVVRLHLLIDENGNVAEVKLLEAIPESDLNQAAIDAARRWKYSPAAKQGQAVRVWKMAAVSFRLDGGKAEVVSVQE